MFAVSAGPALRGSTQLYVFDSKTQSLIKTIDTTSHFDHLAVSPSGSIIAGFFMFLIEFIDVSSGESLEVVHVSGEEDVDPYNPPSIKIQGMVFRGDHELLVYNNSMVKVIDVNTWEVTEPIPLNGMCREIETISPDGRLAFVGGRLSLRSCLIDTNTGDVVVTFPMRLGEITGVSFSLDGTTIAVCAKTGVYILSTTGLILGLLQMENEYSSVVVNDDGSSVFMRTEDEILKILTDDLSIVKCVNINHEYHPKSQMISVDDRVLFLESTSVFHVLSCLDGETVHRLTEEQTCDCMSIAQSYPSVVLM